MRLMHLSCALWRSAGVRFRALPFWRRLINIYDLWKKMIFLNLLPIWTGCSQNGEVPLYLCNGLNYLSCDRLMMEQVVHQSMDQSECMWPMHHCNKPVCGGCKWVSVGRMLMVVEMES